MVPKQALHRNTLARILDLIADETGTTLSGRAQGRLEQLLNDAAYRPAKLAGSDEFSTRDVTILISDLRGFSAVSESHPTSAVLEFLKPYFARMTEVIVRNLGTIDKFMGDSVVAFFDQLPIELGATRAVTCAVEMQAAMDELNANARKIGLPDLHMGIGINTGKVMAGRVGTGQHSEYVVVGREVNMASRIETLSLRGQVLISNSTHECCKEFVLTDSPIEVHVKGITNPVTLREVIAIPSLGMKVPRREIRRSLRVKAELPFMYQIVRDKIVASAPIQGTILDIGYYGVKAELGRTFDPYSEVKMEIDLSIIGYRATDIYARILRVRPGQGGFVARIEFTSLSEQSQGHIRRLVQLLLQGSEGG